MGRCSLSIFSEPTLASFPSIHYQSSSANKFHPDRLGRIILLAMEEILGHEEGMRLFHLSNIPINIEQKLAPNQDSKFFLVHLSRLQSVLDQVYGLMAGRGLSLRIGRACLKYGLREFGSALGVTDQSFRLLPLPARLKVGSKALAGLFNQFIDQPVHLDLDKNIITWQFECCPLCWERQAEKPCCTFAVGFIQEALYWVSGGKTFQVVEKLCIACGDRSCSFVIDLSPIPQ
jgi:hypothetical protein